MTPKGDDRVRCHAYKEPHVVFAPIFCGRCQFSSCGTPSRANAQLDWPVGYEHEKRDIFRQPVNRSLKHNRLPIQRAAPHQAPENGQLKARKSFGETAEIIIVQRNCLSASLA